MRRADSKLPQADTGFFQRREFCLTLDGDIFVRYQSFKVVRLISPNTLD
jgi:DNA primase small subunit